MSAYRLRSHTRHIAPLILALVALLLLPAPALSDPCARSDVVKQSAVLQALGAGTVQVVAANSSNPITVCAIAFTMTGTSPTAAFEYGSGTACATSPVTLTGEFAPGLGVEIWLGGPLTLMTAPPGNALCVVLTGTSPTIQGVLTYVQSGVQ